MSRTNIIKLFMFSLLSLGVLLGFYAYDLLRPIIWTIWCSFILSACAFFLAIAFTPMKPRVETSTKPGYSKQRKNYTESPEKKPQAIG